MSWLDEAAKIDTAPAAVTDGGGWQQRAGRLGHAEDAIAELFEDSRRRALTMERRSYEKIPEQTRRTFREAGYETAFDYDVETRAWADSITALEKKYPQTLAGLDKGALFEMHKQTHRSFRPYAGLYKEAERLVRTGEQEPRVGFRKPEHMAILQGFIGQLKPDEPKRGLVGRMAERLRRGIRDIPSAEEFIGAVIPSDVERVQQLRAARRIRGQMEEPLGGGLIERGIGGAIRLTPSIATGVALGAATGPAAPVAFWGGRGAIEIEDALEAEGITGTKAKVASLAGGAVIGALEKLQLKPVTAPLRKLFVSGVKKEAAKFAGRFLKRRVKETAMEVGIEGLESLVSSGAKAAAGGDISLEGTITDAVTEMVYAAEVFPWLMLPGTAIEGVQSVQEYQANQNQPVSLPGDIARAIAGAKDSSAATLAQALNVPEDQLPAELQDPKKAAALQAELQERLPEIEKAELYGRASEVARNSADDRLKAYGERVKTTLEQGGEVEAGLAARIGREYEKVAAQQQEAAAAEIEAAPEAAPAVEQEAPARPEVRMTPNESLAQDFIQESLGEVEGYYSGIPIDRIAIALGNVGDNILAEFEKAHRLKKLSPEMHEKLRSALVSRGYFREVSLDFVQDVYAGISETDGDLLRRHQEDSKNNPIPPRLRDAAEVSKNIFETLGAEVKKRKMAGLFPESFIKKNMVKITELEDKLRVAEATQPLTEIEAPRKKAPRYFEGLPLEAAEGEVGAAEAAREARAVSRFAIQEQIDDLLAENAALEELGYVPHFVQLEESGQQQVVDAIRRSRKERLSSIPKEHLGRKIPTFEGLEELGIPYEKDMRVIVARYVSYMMHKIAVHDFNQQVQRQGLLAKKTAVAPAGWVEMPGIPQYEGWKVHPAFSEAVRDWTEPAAKTGAIGGLYDTLNTMAKQLKFYNFLVMTWNNMQQGYAAAGRGFFQVHPLRAAKELARGRPGKAAAALLPWNDAFMEVSKKGPLYRAALAADLFAAPPDLPGQAFGDAVRASLDAIDETQPKWWRMIKKATDSKDVWDFIRKTTPISRETVISPTFFGPQNAYFTVQRHLTWWLDRVARTASLMQLTKKYPFHEAVRRARTFHADYNIMRRNASLIARRTFLTPAYQTAMWYKLFPEMMKDPKKYAGPLARIAMMYGTMAGTMSLLGYAWTEGYRFVREDEPDEEDGMGKERVVTMFGPFSEPFKAIGRVMMGLRRGTTPADKAARAAEAVLYNKLAAIPHATASLLRNRDWKGRPIAIEGAPLDEQMKSYGKWLLREIYPITEQVSDWSDEEQTTVNNVLRAAAIMSYTRQPQRDWNEHKMKTKLGELRGWARKASRKNPALKDYYHSKAARLFADYVETLSESQQRHDKRLKAIKSEKGLKKVLRQFDYFAWLPVEFETAAPPAREKQMQLRLWEYTSQPRRKSDETQAAWDKRREKWETDQSFLSEFFSKIDLDPDTAKRLIVKEADRRGAKVGKRFVRFDISWRKAQEEQP